MIDKRVRIILDASVERGKFHVGGGVRIVEGGDDAALGRELRTVEVRCYGEIEAATMRSLVNADEHLQLADDSA